MKTISYINLDIPKEGGIDSGILNEVDLQRTLEVIPLEKITNERGRKLEERRRELLESDLVKRFPLG